MDESLKKIFGVEKMDDPALPGTRPRDVGQVIYVLLPPGGEMLDAFEKVTAKVDPPIPNDGAVLHEHFAVRTPQGDNFYSLYFHGDVEGWRRQIELGARQLGLKMAWVKGETFIVEGGSKFALSECSVTLDGSPFQLPRK